MTACRCAPSFVSDTSESGSDVRAYCDICPHRCSLSEGQTGLCRARVAREGRVVAQNYGRITSMALDPIEKKPLARFHPGSKILSIGSYGCNLACPFCQNASIAQVGEGGVAWRYLSPEDLVRIACDMRAQGNIGIAFTYNEPLVGFEYVHDTALLAREAGLKTVLVSNGFVNEAPLAKLIPLIDAANIDLKGFDEGFYRMVGGKGEVDAVRNAIRMIADTRSCHLEVTTLVIPGENDSEQEIDSIAAWLSGLSPDIPYHVTRFFPQHRMIDRKATPRETVYRLAAVARRHLKHVYEGNC